MASNYPASLDTTATLPAAGGVGANLSTFPHSTLHGNGNDAIIAIQTELGVAPSGAETTVKARLDRVTPTLGPLTTWTAAVQQSVGVACNNVNSKYNRVGRRVEGNALIGITGSGSAGTVILITLPVTATQDNMCIGNGYLVDASTGIQWPFNVFTSTGGLGRFGVATVTAASIADSTIGSGAGGSTAFNLALASGDVIALCVQYDAAAD